MRVAGIPLGVLKKTVSITPVTVTVLDLQFTGANGSTTFTDSSAYGATFTRTGNPTIQDNMGEFTANGYYIKAPQPVAGLWEWGANDFEITGEFTINGVGGYRGIINQSNVTGTSAAFFLYIDASNSNKLVFYVAGYSGQDKVVIHQTAPTANTLHTFKAARHGAYLRLWLDDVESTPVYIGSDPIPPNVTDITVGVMNNPSNTYTLGGRVDNLKIVKFVPPV